MNTHLARLVLGGLMVAVLAAVGLAIVSAPAVIFVIGGVAVLAYVLGWAVVK